MSRSYLPDQHAHETWEACQMRLKNEEDEGDLLDIRPAFEGMVFGGNGPTHTFPLRLKAIIDYVIAAHNQQACKPRKRFRKWDGTTPYAIHPIWCAMTLLTETRLPEEFRKTGAIALLQHDILEDTKALLHTATTSEECRLIREMTFKSFEREVELVWERSPECRLLKCYDKVSNLLDMNWRTDKREQYVAYTQRLIEEVYQRYGELNIITIAQAICI